MAPKWPWKAPRWFEQNDFKSATTRLKVPVALRCNLYVCGAVESRHRWRGTVLLRPRIRIVPIIVIGILITVLLFVLFVIIRFLYHIFEGAKNSSGSAQLIFVWSKRSKYVLGHAHMSQYVLLCLVVASWRLALEYLRRLAD